MKSNKNRERSRDKEIVNDIKIKTKKGKKDKKDKKKINNNIISSDDNDNNKDNQKININHHWKKYFDSKYNQIFYNNPFTGESVWEPPEGAIVEESNGPIEIITSVPKGEEEKSKNQIKQKDNSENKDEDSITEENKESKNVNSYKEIEAIEEEELKERMRYRKMKNLQLKEWLKCPARQQVEESKRK